MKNVASLKTRFYSSENEHGQSIILIAFALVVLLGMAGLVLDGGTMYFSRRDAQNASDAAAFAGARVLVTGLSSAKPVYDAITTYTTANHVPDPATNVHAFFIDASGKRVSEITSSAALPFEATGVEVISTIQVPTVLMGLLTGSDHAPVSARAKAQSGPRSGGDYLMPVTVLLPTGCNPADPLSRCFTLGQVTTLFGDTQAPGSFQFIDWSGANFPDSTAQYIDLTKPRPYVRVGDCVLSSPGMNPNNSITNAIDKWLPPTKALGTSHWKIPIYGSQCTPQGGGNNTGYIVAFIADFIMMGYNFDGQKANPSDFTCGAAPTLTPTSTRTPTRTPTNTPTSTHTSTSTLLPPTPTNTPSKTWTALPSSTSTTVPPTNTKTFTPRPPTITPTNTPAQSRTPTSTVPPTPPPPSPTLKAMSQAGRAPLASLFPLMDNGPVYELPIDRFSGEPAGLFAGGNKCIQGKFVQWTSAETGTPGKCNTNGLNPCAIWLTD